MASKRYEHFRNIERAIDRYSEFVIKTHEEEYKKAEKELKKETVKMYDSYIRQYYRYKTRVYSRHVTGVGTRTGWNLYLAKDFTIETEKDTYYNDIYTFEIDELNIDFDSDKMLEYPEITRKEVLDLVMRGYRANKDFKWKGKYKGKYFSYSGTMHDAFEDLRKNKDKIVNNIAKSKIDRKIDKRYNNLVDIITTNIKEIRKIEKR